MNSAMIGKIEKAHRYARQPERVQIQSLSMTFHGDNNDYEVSLNGDKWSCNCHTFSSLTTCSHVMAMQDMLGKMLSSDARHLNPPVEG